MITLPYCLLWYISWVPSVKTVDSCAKLQSNVSKKTSADNTSVAWCYATWWNAESFLNISWGGDGVARCIFINCILDVTLLRRKFSNPLSTKREEGSEEKASRFFHWFSRCYWVCPPCCLIIPVSSGTALLRLHKERNSSSSAMFTAVMSTLLSHHWTDLGFFIHIYLCSAQNLI